MTAVAKANRGAHMLPGGSDPVRLLPTPTAESFNLAEDPDHWLERRERVKAKGINGNGMGMPLTIAVKLLPTPTCADSQQSGGNQPCDVTLTDAVVRTKMGTEPNPRHHQPADSDESNGAVQDALPVRLLPTPRATDGTKGGPNQRGSKGDLMLPSAVALIPTPALLPTPMVSDTQAAAEGDMRRRSPQLRAVDKLLPTPSVADGAGGHLTRGGDRSDELLLPGVAAQLLPTPRATRGGSNTETAYMLGGARADDHRPQGEVLLPDDVQWGDYEPAIRRWETTAGPVPPPTKVGRTGGARLNPEFASWMMGTPPNWITGVPDVSDNEALRMAGNGVVRQQAAAMLGECAARFGTLLNGILRPRAT